MKRGRSSHAWTAERRKRQLATLAAKRNGQPSRPDDDETVRMVTIIRDVLNLSAAGRAYVLDRIEDAQ